MRCLLAALGLWMAVALAGESVRAENAPGTTKTLVVRAQLPAQLGEPRRPEQPVGAARRGNDAEAAGRPAGAANTQHAQPKSQPQAQARTRTYTVWPYPYGGAAYPYGYGYLPGGYVWYGPGYYPYYPSPDWPWALPPLYAPAESQFGPDSVKRFMGADRGLGPGIGGDVNRAKEAPANQRATNAESVAMGRRFMRLGDDYFRAGKYSLAYDRYRNASQAAPRVADAYIRQGFALAALGRYEAAAREFKRGMELDPDWASSDFRLADLYGDNGRAKSAHLDAMAKAADAKSESSDLLFLIGLYLHFDGQVERARPFFQRADQLAGGNAAHLAAFLDPLQPVEP
jgi:tetratricopeptide (TPR) repeat protein